MALVWVQWDKIHAFVLQQRRETFFSEAQGFLCQIKTFADFHTKCRELASTICDMGFTLPRPSEEHFYSLPIDITSCSMYPADASSSALPRYIIGDGNCLFNTFSQALWGQQIFNRELRIRSTIELALHEEFYLDHDKLKQGTISQDPNIPGFYVQGMSHYTGEKTTVQITKKLYR